MIRVAAIVEGYGDVEAVPTLIAKAGGLLGYPAIAPQPIRAGEWIKLRRPGALESYLDLAASRQPDLVLVLLDLDDGCAVSEVQDARARVVAWRGTRTIAVEVVFLVREYETMFLCEPNCFGIPAEARDGADPEAVRGAKERVKAVTGKRYRETQDQLSYTQQLDLAQLYRHSRPFRRLCKALTGFDYDVLDLIV